jgi:hypothetical protein
MEKMTAFSLLMSLTIRGFRLGLPKPEITLGSSLFGVDFTEIVCSVARANAPVHKQGGEVDTSWDGRCIGIRLQKIPGEITRQRWHCVKTRKRIV